MKVLPPNDTPTELYMLLGRMDGKLDGVKMAVDDIGRRQDAFERRLGVVEHSVGAIEAERRIQVPQFKAVAEKVEGLDGWRTELQTTGKNTKALAGMLWGAGGASVLGFFAWLAVNFAPTHPPAVIHRETTKVESTVTAPTAGAK